MQVSDFDYKLPEALIAQTPAPTRAASRLLHMDRRGAVRDMLFADLPALLRSPDVVVLNDTRVIKARLTGRRATGGRVELFVERITADDEALALVRASHAPKSGTELVFDGPVRAIVIRREDDLFRVRFPGCRVEDVLVRHGAVPLPPYIRHAPESADVERYQTVYADRPGAVAAPTAGLHFDQPMLDHLAAQGIGIARITLHVGTGTFQPVRTEALALHRMHRERYDVPQTTVHAIERARNAGGRVLAVGTTSLRALETAAADGLRACSGETDLFVTPGFRFRVVDRLLTNFHLPRSTLLMLVSAFGGMDNIRRAYAHAIREQYRFFSYGDAMLIEREAGA